jgi:hypothetical protein
MILTISTTMIIVWHIPQALSPSSESNTTTMIDATWKIDLSGIPLIGRGYAKNGIMKTTEAAFDKIAQTVE